MRGKWIVVIVLAVATVAGFSMALVMKRQSHEHRQRIENAHPHF